MLYGSDSNWVIPLVFVDFKLWWLCLTKSESCDDFENVFFKMFTYKCEVQSYFVNYKVSVAGYLNVIHEKGRIYIFSKA